MKFRQSKFSLFGLLLITVGVLLLFRNLDIISLHFYSIFLPLVMLLGMIGVVQGFSSGKRGKIFWSTVVFLYALFFFLHSLDSIEVGGYLFIPVSLIIFGFAFLMMYLANVREWLILIPSLVLLGMGSIFLLDVSGYIDGREAWYIVQQYWPIVIILLGLWLLLRKKTSSASPPPDSHSVT